MKKLGTVVVSLIALAALIGAAYTVVSGDTSSVLSLSDGSAALAGPAPHRPPRQAAPVMGCDYRSGQTLAFRVESTATARNAAGRDTGLGDRFESTMSVAVASTDSKGSTLTVAFSDVALDQNLARPTDRIGQPLTDTFEVDVATDCRITAYRFPKSWSRPARNLAIATLSSQEMVQSPEDSWTTTQTDAVAPHQCRYRRLSDRLQRKKLFYQQSGLEEFGMAIQLEHAIAEAVYGPGGLQRVTGRERVKILMGGQLQADLEQWFTLTRDDAAFRKPAAAMALVDAREARDERAATLPVASTDPAEARRIYQALVHRLARLTVRDAHTLASLLRAHPELLRALSGLMDTGRLTPTERASAFWALELTANDAARAALVSWLGAEDPTDRARAAVALSGAGEPTMEMGQHLAAVYTDDPDADVAGTGLMALGALAPRANDEVRAYVHATLSEALSTAGSQRETLQALNAMGNAADSTFLEPLRQHLEADDPLVRGRAARALAKLGDQGRADLRNGLSREEDLRSAAWFAAALRSTGPASAQEVPWAEAQLQSPSPQVRAELIRWLGAAGTPEAQAALAQHFRVERSTELRRLIGRFVSASAITRS